MLSLHAPGGRAVGRRHVFRLTSEKERTPMGTWNTRGLRGSTLEDFINHTNDSYREKHLALIQKIPTPITPIEIDKASRHITLGEIQSPSAISSAS